MTSGSEDHYGKEYAREDISQDVDISITRNADNYITEIVEANGTYTKTITVTRNADNYITAIAVEVK